MASSHRRQPPIPCPRTRWLTPSSRSSPCRGPGPPPAGHAPGPSAAPPALDRPAPSAIDLGQLALYPAFLRQRFGPGSASGLPQPIPPAARSLHQPRLDVDLSSTSVVLSSQLEGLQQVAHCRSISPRFGERRRRGPNSCLPGARCCQLLGLPERLFILGSRLFPTAGHLHEHRQVVAGCRQSPGVVELLVEKNSAKPARNNPWPVPGSPCS